MSDLHAEAQALVRRTTAAQGIPEQIKDTATIKTVAQILATPSNARGRRAS
jgi:hypothetical protein